MEKLKNRCYVIWQQAADSQQHFIAVLKEHISELETALHATVVLQEDNEGVISFLITSEMPINVHKMLRSMQKQLIKLEEKLIENSEQLHKQLLEEKNWLVITPAQTAQESIRLKKIFQSIRETSYHDVNHLYGPEPKMMMTLMADRPISIIDWGEKTILLDQQALLKRINLNCKACTAKYEYGCCCGSPCQYSRKNLAAYKQHEQAILEEMKSIEPAFYERIKKQYAEADIGGQMELVGFDGSVGECDGRCMLLVRHEGMAKCLAHKYALEHDIPVYTISPLSCLMFPFEVIECLNDKGKKILLFSGVVEEEVAEKIGRWGSYRGLGISLACIDDHLCDEVFKEEDYSPVYQVNKGLITHEFGEPIYKAVDFALRGQEE